MFEKKPCLHVNCALLDATNVKEETLSAYDRLHFNCAVVLQSEESRTLMSRYPSTMNCANVMTVSKDCRSSVINGNKTLSAADKMEEPSVLIVNGSLSVLPDAGEALRSYAALVVNGSLLCPDSLEAAVSGITVNGSTRFYPHNAVLLDRSLDMDPFFILQAKPDALYYVTGEVRMTEEGLPLETLLEKRIKLMAKKAVVRAGCLSIAAEILCGDVKILTVPDGCAYVRQSAPLRSLITRYGKSLFLHGSLQLTEEDREALSSLDYLEVQGKTTLPQSLEELFCQKCKKFQELEVLTEKTAAVIEDLPEATITRQLLENCSQKLHIADCDAVRFDADIPPELLGKIRDISDCAVVFCTREQQALLQLVCSDIGKFMDSSEETGKEQEEERQQTVKVNCAFYTL
ncbi:MAG: hypothetical protein HFG27_05830 [Provencibacterium sp.]|nr:hypothetical protein [Provencibacterium sp.]